MNGDRSGVAVVDAQPLRGDALAIGLAAHDIDVTSDLARAALAVVHHDARDRLLELGGTPYLLLDRGGAAAGGRAARQALATVPASGDLSGLVAAVSAALAGDRVSVATPPPRRETPSDSDREVVGRLSGRERSVLECLARGLSNQEIGSDLGISANTARTHVQNILLKLSVTSRHAAVARARRGGLELEESR